MADTQTKTIKDFLSENRELQATGEHAAAMEVLRAGSKAYPLAGQFDLHLGSLHSLTGDHESAYQAFSQAIEKAPGQFMSYALKGTTLATLGRIDEAITVLHDGRKLFPNIAQFDLRLGQAYTAKNDYAAGLEYYSSGIKKAPDRHIGYIGQVNALIALGQIDRAKHALKSATAQFPEIAFFQRRLGQLHAMTSAHDTALDCFDAALALEPDHFLTYLMKAKTLIALGKGADTHQVRREMTDQIEKIVLEIWADILEFPDLTLDDDFFQIGGDSLKAEELMMALEKRFAFKLALDLLIERPTPRLISATIDPFANKVDQPLIYFKTTGTKPPLILLHNLAGNIMQYRPLARQLSADRPALGMSPPNIVTNSGGDEVTINQIAAAHVKQLLGADLKTPFLLCGHSYAGTLAFETAAQLERLDKVVHLILLDTRPPTTADAWRNSNNEGSLFENTRRALLPAAKKYQPGNFAGETLLFLASEQSAKDRQATIDGWASLLTGKLHLETVEGDHISMMSEYNTIALSRRLEPYLAQWSKAPTIGAV